MTLKKEKKKKGVSDSIGLEFSPSIISFGNLFTFLNTIFNFLLKYIYRKVQTTSVQIDELSQSIEVYIFL